MDEHAPPTGPVRGERKEPVLVAVVVSIAIPFFLPESFLPGHRLALSSLEVLLLLAMVFTDPGRIDRRGRGAHLARLALVLVLVFGAAWATVLLTIDLIEGSDELTNSATQLLQAGALVWGAMILAFSLLYWELDRGGPGERVHGTRPHLDLAFPQQLNPDIGPPGWRPVYFDYLYLSLTSSLAFSPTDVMPLHHWAKATMAVQSLASVVILGLVVARAVNILT